ncbi:MAG: ATP-binding protein [Planctomycetaceae bacterium]
MSGSALPPPTGATERRLVSVLFLDLVAFTTLSEQRDAEEMRELLSRYFETARTVITRYGGVVEKFIGDAVMAVWGVPVTHEDDAERAVRAALELVDAVEALGEATGAPLRARGGVLTGEAATMAGGEAEGMVTGDMVNTSSRLQSAAEPGAVFVGDATYRAANRAIVFEDGGHLALKGKEEPVHAWRALRVVAQRQGANRLSVEPPFVGRSEELRMLKDLLHASGREGKSRVVSVTGIGGIGKSRLAWELLKYIDGLTEVVYWHHGRCPSYGEGVTFWALGEMVRMRAGIAETEAVGPSRQKLADAVAEFVPEEEERRWVEPRLAFLLGLEDKPPGGRDELFAAWRTFFERITALGTVVMVFEDLQWADAGLLDFVESMLEWSRSVPLMVVTLARPELADRRPNWGAAQRNFVSVHLEPLDGDAMREMVGRMIPGAGEDSIAAIVERAEGVPLYAVETIRMLADRGVLRAGEDAYELVGSIGDLEVPETLHALVASRLDALSTQDRALLQDAAVLGTTFALEALAAVTGTDTDTLLPRLQDLGRRELLVQQIDPRSPERGQYGFVQGIIREVAYGMLARADRRARHLAVAHHFESEGDPELAGLVAAHYVEALHATPAGPDADAMAARARDWLGQAAERATALGSPLHALASLDQALAITPSGVERATLLRQAADASAAALRREQAIANLREAADVFGEAGDVESQVATMGRLVSALFGDNRVEGLSSITDQMRTLLGTSEDPLARAELAYAEAIRARLVGGREDSIAQLDLACAGFERAGAVERFTDSLTWRAHLLATLGRHRESEILHRGMLSRATKAGDRRGMAIALGSLSVSAGEVDEALRYCLEQLEVARKAGLREEELTAISNGIEFAVECGDWDVADRFLAEMTAMPDLPKDLEDTAALGTVLLAAYRGDRATARSADEGIGAVEGYVVPPLRAWIQRVRAVERAMAGDLEAAVEEALGSIAQDPAGMNSSAAVWSGGHAAIWMRDAERLRALLASTPPEIDRPWSTAARRAHEAALAALDGNVHEAATQYDAVLAERLSRGDRFFHAQMAIDAAAVLPPDLAPEGAVEAARTYLADLGAHGLLERLDIVLTGRAAAR